MLIISLIRVTTGLSIDEGGAMSVGFGFFVGL